MQLPTFGEFLHEPVTVADPEGVRGIPRGCERD